MSVVMREHLRSVMLEAQAQKSAANQIKTYTGRPRTGAAARLAELASTAKSYFQKWRQDHGSD